MTLSDRQIFLVQSTFEDVVVDIDSAATVFYARLFELDPALRPLFKVDMTLQGRKLMQMLLFAVNGLNEPEKFSVQLHELGERHRAYGAKREDYHTIGAALVWTVQQKLGDDFTEEIEYAWTAAYRLIAADAIDGGYGG